MSMFEGIMAACVVAIAFVKVYDWVDYHLEMKREREEMRDG